ncbi:hypothetical protein OOJ91_12165 [Micromonospora lupini]|uniref:hypothetical protein n=1 Tax=Micromonospora lupini TaxID=285679 RepID=UPI0022576506|nr:hypothetical protein [Micromonospora lupini]MCX5066633.1 hypothetical protein [Micromonospora lupini]
MIGILCLGGPLHGQRIAPRQWPPPPEVIAAAPRWMQVNMIDLDQPPAPDEPPDQVPYRLQQRHVGCRDPEWLYVAPRLRPPPFHAADRRSGPRRHLRGARSTPR